MERPFVRVWSGRSGFKVTEGRLRWDIRDRFFAEGVLRPHLTHSWLCRAGLQGSPTNPCGGSGKEVWGCHRLGVSSHPPCPAPLCQGHRFGWVWPLLCSFKPLQQQPGSLLENLHGAQSKLKHFAALHSGKLVKIPRGVCQ